MDKESLEEVVSIAHRASDELMKHFRKLAPEAIESKDQAHDLVTIADRASEDLIVESLKTRFPGTAILAEETGRSGAEGEAEKAEALWIVDPLDGTVNFVHGLPFFAVSIGLYQNGAPELGVVAAPALGEVFAAQRGAGATLNGEPIRVSNTPVIGDSLLTTGFAYEREGTPNPNLPNFSRVVYKARSTRRPGSAAIDLAYVAAGRFDGFWEAHLSPWDVAAGALLVQESGGRVGDFNGGEAWLWGENILATNGRIHRELESLLEFDPELES